VEYYFHWQFVKKITSGIGISIVGCFKKIVSENSISTGGSKIVVSENINLHWPLSLAVRKNDSINRFRTELYSLCVLVRYILHYQLSPLLSCSSQVVKQVRSIYVT
jgi:hypothetical protein